MPDEPPLIADLSRQKRSQRLASSKRRQSPAPARGIPARCVPVILVGPDGLFAEGLQQILKAYNYRVIAAVPSLGSVDAGIMSKARLVIVIEPSAEPMLAQTVSALRDDDPALRFVLLVDTTHADKIAAALRVPAHAFLCQTIGCEPLMKALDVVLGDGAVLSLDLMSYLMSHPDGEGERQSAEAQPSQSQMPGPTPPVGSCRPLSEREVDILRCLTDGDSNKLIARRFKIAESTVKIHIKGILRKINVQNRTQAAIWALSCVPPLHQTPNGPTMAQQQPTA